MNLEDRGIFEDFREYNLRKENNYYLYDHSKYGKLDYINKNQELKNIFRSYLALQIFLAKDNLDFILGRFENSLCKVINTVKDAFDTKNNACIEHAVILLKALITAKPKETLDIVINKHALVILALLDNKAVHNLFCELLLRPQCLMIDLTEHRELILKPLQSMRFFEVLLDMACLSSHKYEGAVFEFVLEREKQVEQEKAKLEKERVEEEEQQQQAKKTVFTQK